MITSSSQRSIPTTVKSGSSTLQNRRSVKLLDYSSDISGYHAEFHEGHGTVGAWHGRGMGTACYVWIGQRSPAIRSQSRQSQEPVELLSPCLNTSGNSQVRDTGIEAELTDLTVSGPWVDRELNGRKPWLDRAWILSVSITVIINIYAQINANVGPLDGKNAMVEYMYYDPWYTICSVA